eukprot:5220280-Prymnesium_polylepis.1
MLASELERRRTTLDAGRLEDIVGRACTKLESYYGALSVDAMREKHQREDRVRRLVGKYLDQIQKELR